ncbi:MAG TPA: hypothetical protein VFC24_12275 [Casimicrobiaceae bacterium]|nr:hypothetical protein [Casimicrobiaceae bacterium]
MYLLRSLMLVVAAAVVPGLALAQDPGKVTNGMLTNSAGMTLYTFDKDSGGKSACNGACANLWPPLKAGADAKASGDWGTIAREDGSKQWTFKGKPVYVYSKDTKAGDKTGDNFGNVWHIAQP